MDSSLPDQPQGARVEARRLPLRMTFWLHASVLLALFLLFVPHAQAKTDFLDPAEAFRFSARMADARTLEVHYQIADGYYLYRERFHFETDPAQSGLGEPQFPPGTVKFDEVFKKNEETYRHEVTVRIPVKAGSNFTLLSTAQGCADAGLCYPPQVSKASFTPSGASPSSNLLEPSANPGVTLPGAAAPAGAAMAASSDTSAAEMTRFEAALSSGNIFQIALVFVTAGLLLAFTPCVLPMLPILSTIIANDAHMPVNTDSEGRRKTSDRLRGLSLAVAYSLGMALVYTTLGVMAGLAGESLAAALQTPAVLYSFAGVLIVLSLSMFDVYQLQMPAGIQLRLSNYCGRIGGGRMFGVFVMGALSALIVGPCVAAPLAATLITISRTRDVFIGGSALFFMAVGMSLPLLVLGVSEGALLPRAGKWMEGVKRFFGVLLIAVAIWMIEPVAPAWLEMFAVGGLLVVTSVYLHVFDPLPSGAGGWSRFWKGVGVLLLLCGAAQIIGVATGGRDVFQPLGQLASRGAARGEKAPAGPALAFQQVHSTTELDARLLNPGRPVMLAFSAAWCTSCKELERITFTDNRVVSQLNNFVLLEADVTDVTASDKEMLKRFNLFGPPGVLFFDQAGHPVPAATVIGFENPEGFLASLAKVTS